MHIANEHALGHEVYLKTDPDQFVRIVVAITVEISGSIMYELAWSTLTTRHYAGEISAEKRIF